MLAAFFGNAKLILGSVITFVGAIFLYIFKARGKEIKEQRDTINELEREAHIDELVETVSEEVNKDFLAKELEIEEEFDEKEQVVYKSTNKPLSPTLLGKLRDVQGLQNSSDEHPK